VHALFVWNHHAFCFNFDIFWYKSNFSCTVIRLVGVNLMESNKTYCDDVDEQDQSEYSMITNNPEVNKLIYFIR
jgi:hypothetical protein